MSSHQTKLALPLVLPNNCEWKSETKEFSNLPNIERKTLHVIPEGLNQLKNIKGPVCVISITGPYRIGKSYILGKVVDQEQEMVFPLGRSMQAETMGIWLWVVPEKFKDKHGQEFTVVLLDTEGTGSTKGKKSQDHRVFTLSVLLSSILIYNSQNVPEEKDVSELDFINKLSERIQLYANPKKNSRNEEVLREALPKFVWLLRDVLLGVPEGYEDIKDYMLHCVLNNEEEHTESSRLSARSILCYFSGFDAFCLPPPSVDKYVAQHLDDPSVQHLINPSFLEEIQTFKNTKVKPLLSQKRSLNDGELVTGEALAKLVGVFVDVLNTPGAVPNVQNAWDTFVTSKCNEVLAAALNTYEQGMASLVKECRIPCKAEVLRSAHDKATEESLEMFFKETFSLSTKSVDPYCKRLTAEQENILLKWIEKNKHETNVCCTNLAKELERKHLEPVLLRLRSDDGCNMDFNEIVDAYNDVEREYKEEGPGDDDSKAAVFLDIHSRLAQNMAANIEILQNLKNYNFKVITEITNNARIQAEKERIEDERQCLEAEKKAKEKQLTVLQKKYEDDKKKIEQMFEQKLKDQQEALKNMIEAKFKKQAEERKQIMDHQQNLKDMIKAQGNTLEARNQEIRALQTKITSLSDESKDQVDRLTDMFSKQVQGLMVEKQETSARQAEYMKNVSKEIGQYKQIVQQQEMNLRSLQEQKENAESQLTEALEDMSIRDDNYVATIQRLTEERDNAIDAVTDYQNRGRLGYLWAAITGTL